MARIGRVKHRPTPNHHSLATQNEKKISVLALPLPIPGIRHPRSLGTLFLLWVFFHLPRNSKRSTATSRIQGFFARHHPRQ